MSIRDTNGDPIEMFSTSIQASSVQTYTVKIDCETDYELVADAVSDLTVEAKRTADVSWINIETTPIDLSAWNGTLQEFQVRVTAANSPGVERAFSVRVRYTG